LPAADLVAAASTVEAVVASMAVVAAADAVNLGLLQQKGPSCFGRAGFLFAHFDLQMRRSTYPPAGIW
jgi:hypothetical protein